MEEGAGCYMFNVDIKVGNIIRNKRREKEFTTAELAERLEVSNGFLNNLENGKTQLINYDLVNKLCNELGIDVVPFVTEIITDFNMKEEFVKENSGINRINKDDYKSQGMEYKVKVENNIKRINKAYLACIESNR